ncbi:MAG: hypothetical protein CSA81_04260 [Acidobacteria bacterium]|nr:MAG: hypothetical protein CSA81_04260 [Acidobacteriota bacterium]
MSKHESIKRSISPFYFSQKLLSTPPKRNFTKNTGSTFAKNLKNFLYRWKNKQERNAEAFYNKGFKAHVIGKIDTAMTYYKQCLEIDPHHFAALNNMAGACAHTKNFDKARDYLEQALFGTRGISMVYYNLGLLLRAMDQEDGAIEAFQQAIELKPNHFWAILNLAEILVDRVQFKDAIDCYLRAQPIAPDPVTVKLRLAELYYLENDFAKAELMFRELLEQRETPEALYNLSWLLIIQEKAITEAIALLHKSRLKKTPYHEALFNLAVAESMNGQFTDSLNHMMSYTNQTTPMDLRQLVKNYRVLVMVNVNNTAASMEIAISLFKDGYDDEAIRELRLLLRRKPNDLETMKLLSRFEYETGQKDLALRTCREILKLVPDRDCLDVYLLMSKIYGSQGDYATAMSYIKKAIDINPALPDLNYQYATFLAQQGDFSQALKYYKKIAATAPGYPRIQSRIRMVEEELREKKNHKHPS